MKTKSALILFLFIAFAFASGSAQTKKDDLIRIKIDAGQFKSSGNVSDYLEVVKLIPLETTKECLIGDIDKVVQYRNNIYVFDSKTYKLLWFDSSGKFLGQIGQRGKGPGEYIEVSDFEVDTIRGLIYLPDFHKVHVFSATGKWIKSVSTDFMAGTMSRAGNHEFIFYGAGRDDKMIKTDANFKVMHSFFPWSPAYRLAPFYPLASYAGRNIFHIPFCDTLYTFDGVKPDPLIYMDFCGMNFTKRDFDRLAKNEQENLHEYLLASSKYVTCRGFLPVKQQAFFFLSTSNKAYWGLYNLATNQYSFVALPKLVNDIYGSYSYFHPIGITRDEFIFSATPDKLIQDKTSSFYKKYSKVLDGLTELSNPVLLLAKSKI